MTAITWLVALVIAPSMVMCTLDQLSTDCVKSNKYLQGYTATCAACPANSVSIPSGLGCECQSTAFTSSSTLFEFTPSCTPCASDQVVRLDGRGCIKCPASLSTSSTPPCACAGADEIVVDTQPDGSPYAERQCVACQSGLRPMTLSGALYPTACIPCGDPTMATVTGMPCRCPSGFVDISGTCINNILASGFQLSTSDKSVDIQDVARPFESFLLASTLQLALIGCIETDGVNQTACNQLANLCVVSLYDDTSRACREHTSLYINSDSTPFSDYQSWLDNNPFILFEDEDVELSQSIACFHFDSTRARGWICLRR
eukprot:m.215214 g.215214  ORF g.215214 m.215214 type:complete len:316 (-) comp15105_c1_seq37:5175-6122(-)